MNLVHVAYSSLKKEFVADLKPKYILPYLLEERIISKEENKAILSQETIEEQIDELFNIISKTKLENFKLFLQVLEGDSEDVNYPWLAKKLAVALDLQQDIKISFLETDVNKILVRGGVPFKTNCFLRRERKILDVQEALQAASNQRRWVVLHGMTGTGKSILAAEALRNDNLIKNCFSDGVFWLPVGKIKDKNSLTLKMKMLFKLMNCEDKYISSPDDLSDLTFELKNIVSSKKILVVLDKVWEQKREERIDNKDILSFFDIGCPILVTTKYQSVCRNYSQYCFPIECKNDFSVSEGKQLIALHVSCDVNDLPDEVGWICEQCKGSPFILSHIGRWMASHGNIEKHWLDLKHKLEKIKPIRHRHLSGEDSGDIKDIVFSTLEPINEHKEFFFDFVIFPEDDPVPIQVFEVMWGKNSSETDRILHSLHQASLVTHTKEPSDSDAYGIHDIYLEILTEICTTNNTVTNIKKRHERLINQYLHMCEIQDGKFDFSLLSDHVYILKYLAYHIEKAEKESFFKNVTIDDIFFDLKFIEAKIRLDPGDLLSDYISYKSLFKNKLDLEHYIQFARNVKNSVYYNHQDWDVIQWGLFEPHNSIIFGKASELASKSSDKVYYKWCNQMENSSYRQTVSTKLNTIQKMQDAAISLDGRLIACVGDQNEILVFCSQSGKELKALTGHSDTINCCNFNLSGSKLVTASEDKTVKIFSIDIPFGAVDATSKKRSSMPELFIKAVDLAEFTFNLHRCPVLSCSFSPSEDLIVSCDKVGCVYVWQSTTGHIKFRTKYNEGRSLHEAKCCSFNPNETLFAASAYDGIKVWSLSDGHLVKEVLHNEKLVMDFCFDAGNNVLSIADNILYKSSVHTDFVFRIDVKKSLILTSCCVSSDSNWVACGTSDCKVLVYNINNGKQVDLLKGHRSTVYRVMYALEDKYLMSASENGYMIHNVSSRYDVSLVSFEGQLSVRQGNDQLIIAASNSKNCIEVRTGIYGELKCETSPDDSDITACSLSPDCAELVYGTENGSLKVLNIQTQFLEVLSETHAGKISFITHFKNLFFSCSADKTIKVWSNKSSTILRGHRDTVVMCVPFKFKNKLLSCSRDGTLRVWNIEEGSSDPTDGHGNQDVRCCDLSFDELYMASASADQTVKIYLTDNGRLFKTIHCGSEVKCCRFSPKFQFLIAGCDCGKVICSELISKREVPCHQSCVSNIIFTKDGQRYLTAADDIKIWKVSQAAPHTLTLPSSGRGITYPSIWASDTFDILVVVHDSSLYILKKL